MAQVTCIHDPGNRVPDLLDAAAESFDWDRMRAICDDYVAHLANPQFSLQDNALLDYDDRVLHYRSPTEPGSSGSPVFDGRWDLVGLHHASLTDAPRLNDRGGLYSANEGIALDAIRRELEAAPPAPR